MSNTDKNTDTIDANRWKRPAYLILVVAALATVLFAWFYTPTAVVASSGGGDESRTLQCSNAGPSRWGPPYVSRGQELSNDPTLAMQSHNQQILKNDIESIRAELACGQARTAHTNTLIVTVFGAGTALFFGHAALWVRRDQPAMRTVAV